MKSMPGFYNTPSRDRDTITIPTLWVAFVLSIAFHAAGLFGWVPEVPVPFQEPKLGQPSGSLAIRLVPPTSPPLPSLPSSTASAPAPAAAKAPAQRRASPKRTVPPVLAMERPSPPALTSPKAQPPAAAVIPSPTPAPAEDLAAYIASKKRAREGPAAPPVRPAETEQERHNRTVAENLGLTNTPTFGNDPDRGGGVFQIRSMGYDIAEFAFFGWNKDIKRNSLQVIEVRRGNSENMEIAVARKVIGMVRERVTGDFLWQSRRLGRGVWLSSSPADSAELEDFILKELFPEPRPR
jgi:hypothetical protein